MLKRPLQQPEGNPPASGAGANEKKKKKKKGKAQPFQQVHAAPRPDKGKKKKDGSSVPNSLLEADQTFDWLIAPTKASDFYKEYWGKRHLVIKRSDPSYYAGVFTKDDMDHMFRKHDMKYTTNVDITNYVNGERQTLNPEGRVNAGHVWKMYGEGCSVRLLNPQTFHKRLWGTMAKLQEHFGCGVGANTYLTPVGAQGFAPHYDDVDVFILQTEGSKTWRLYAPRTPNEVLPRESSGNFAQGEIGKPILEVTLEEGDLLYFPRGVIHQAYSPPATHSLHVTISTFMKNTWGDLLERAIPRALQIAMEEDVEFRKGLPRSYMEYMGVMHSDQDLDPRRKAFLEHFAMLWDKLTQYMPHDAAADQMAVKYIHDALPPALSDKEIEATVVGGEFPKFTKETSVRLIRALACRSVMEADAVVLYHVMDNTRVYHQDPEPAIIEFSLDCTPAIEALITNYEDGWVQIKELPHEDDPTGESRIDVVAAMYEKGLISIQKEDKKWANSII
eukprot:TRINITY_DN7762_c0_g1_i1.p1 TRINITY_DN7762_c0_g1~~TRINITY_DN7762_c0_g1_i1.p1  ORF type:complete len:503 (-),score=165.32 TRINITY_DN7762_c0_g1_i1:21-1529(-)